MSALTALNSFDLSTHANADVTTAPIVVNGMEPAYVLWFTSGVTMKAKANSMEHAFSSNDVRIQAQKKLVQLVIEAVTKLRAKFRDTPQDKVTHKGDPVSMYWEAVPRIDTPQTSTGLRRPRASDSEMDLSVDDTPAQAECVFLDGFPDTVEIAEWRLWIFCHEYMGDFDFGDILFSILNSSHEECEKYKQNQGSNAARSSSRTLSYNPNQTYDFGRTLKDFEAFKLVQSKKQLAALADNMLMRAFFTRSDVSQMIMNREVPNSQNPIHPKRFMKPELRLNLYKLPGIDPKQNSMAEYKKNGNWTFPYSTRVVQVKSEYQTREAFFAKVLPHYQRTIQPSFRRLVRPRLSGPRRDVSQALVPSDDRRPTQQYPHADEFFADVDPIDDEEGGTLTPFEAMNRFNPDGTRRSQADRAMEAQVLPSLEELETLDEHELSRYGMDRNIVSDIKIFMGSEDLASRSAVHAYVAQWKPLKAELESVALDQSVSLASKREYYLALQQKRLSEYSETCMFPDSKLSRVGTKINEWFQDFERDNNGVFSVHKPLILRNMSMFASMITRIMTQLESGFLVATSHARILLNYFGALDAYDHRLGLRFSAFYTGLNQSSKSNDLNVLSKMLIPHTTIPTLESTDKGDYGDLNEDDEIVLVHELPIEVVGRTNNGLRSGNPAKVNLFKQILTEGFVMLKVFNQDPDTGVRSYRYTYSEKRRVHIGVANDQLRDFDPNILSRVLAQTVPKVVRENHSLVDMIGAEERQRPEHVAMREDLIRESQIRQYLCFHIQKLIAGGALTNVTLTCYDIIKKKVLEYLNKTFAIDVQVRMMKLFSFFTRQLVIATVIEYTYFHPMSPHYMQPFDVMQLAYMDPLLHDTEEIAYFAFELAQKSIMGDTMFTVIRGLRNWFETQVHKHDIEHSGEHFEALFLTSNTMIVPSTAMGIGSAQRVPPAPVNPNQQGNGNLRSFGMGAAQAAGLHTAENQAFPSAQRVQAGLVYASHPERMNAYARFTYRTNQCYQNIIENANVDERRLTMEEVKAAFANFRSNKTLRNAHIYEWDHDTGMPKRTTRTADMPCIIEERGDLFIHLDLMQPHSDPFQEAIKYSFHGHHTGDELDMLRGQVFSEQIPNIFMRRAVHAGMGHQTTFYDVAEEVSKSDHLVTNPTTTSDDFLRQTRDGIKRITESYDHMSIRDRAKRLFIDVGDDPDDSVLSHVRFEEWAREPDPERSPMESGRRPLRYVHPRAAMHTAELVDDPKYSRRYVQKAIYDDLLSNGFQQDNTETTKFARNVYGL